MSKHLIHKNFSHRSWSCRYKIKVLNI
uniref:Uncharacterized protein n=1 Tax=Rhizophora mucronata TaxID=61149 RepID=A0A2P2P976_RHIMU